MAECFLNRTIIGGGVAEEEYLEMDILPIENLCIRYSGETLRLKLRSGTNALTLNTVDGRQGYSPKSIIIDQGTGTALTIQQSCFNYLRNTLIYDFSNFTFVPGMWEVGFYDINPEAQILVPSSLRNTWASNGRWVIYASQIVGV